MSAWLCLYLFLLPGVSGQVVDDGQTNDARVLIELNDDDYRVRQAATRRLLGDEALTQDDLDRLFIASETPEQRHRLLRVARHRVLREMIRDRFDDQPGPGSMGLSHQTARIGGPGDDQQVGVMVVTTLPGFPAYALLEPNDVIVGFAGEAITEKATADKFPELIRRHQAGEEVDLTVLRDGAPMLLRFRLGNGQALGEVYNTTELILNPPYSQAWAAVQARMRGLVDDGTEVQAEATDHNATSE